MRKKLTLTVLAILLIATLGGCTISIDERECIVTKIEATDYHNYKYKVTITAHIADQSLYTNTKFEIGDTVKFSR